MDIDDIDEFIIIDKRIDAAEDRSGDAVRESLRDRWEFGRLLLTKRRGKQLPKGDLTKLAKRIGKSERELRYRMQFAERYPTEAEVCTAVQTFSSWTQLRKSLPQPSPQGPRPAPHPKYDEVIELHEQGANRFEIAEATGVHPRSVDRVVREERIAAQAVAEATPIDWNTIPGNQQAKLDRAKAAIRKQLEKEFRTRLLAELDQYHAKLDADFAAHKAAYDAQNAALNAMRDEERRRYKEGIAVYRAKGLITSDEYNTIRSCLHPDSRASVTEEKLAAAFRLFNESRIKTLLVKET